MSDMDSDHTLGNMDSDRTDDLGPTVRKHSQDIFDPNDKAEESLKDGEASDKMTKSKFFAIIALAASSTGSQIPDFFLGPALLFIADDLHIGSERSWIAASHTLAAACIAPCAGYIQDLAGRRLSLAFGLLCTCLGAIVIATATNFPSVVAGSTLHGIGAAIQELTSIAAISELVPVNKRGIFLGVNIIFSLLFTPAVLYSQLLGKYATWRWLFWIALIWNGVAAGALGLTYFRAKIARVNRTHSQLKLKEIDWIGIVLLIVGLTIFLVALQAGGITHPWTSAYVLVQLIVGFFCLVALAVWESRDYGKPLIPFRLFRGQRVIGLSIAIAMASAVNYTSTLNLGPEIFQSVFNVSDLRFGVLALPPSLVLLFGAIFMNALFSPLGGYARELLTVSSVIMLAFTGAQAVISPEKLTDYVILGTFAAFGLGATLLPTTTIVTFVCPEDLIGTAVALLSTSRSVGGSIGYTILYNVFLSKSDTAVPQQMAPRLIQAGLPKNETESFIQSFAGALANGYTPPQASQKIEAAALLGFEWGTSLAAQYVFYVSIPFGALAVVASLCLPSMKQYMSNKVLTKYNH